MGLVIKKRVSLEFLGDEYKDSYIVIKALPLNEYDDIQKSEATVKDTVINRFIEGKINQDDKMVDITKDNIEELPGEVFVEAFDKLIGRIDPKSQGQLLSPSSTDQKPPTN